MNTEIKSPKSDAPPPSAAKIKTLNLELAVSERDLQNEIKNIFDLAKSAGQELNLTFSYGSF